jgi:hypothetical protein
MFSAWVIEAVDIFKDSQFSLAPCMLGVSPNKFGLNCLEEHFHCGVAVAITFA